MQKESDNVGPISWSVLCSSSDQDFKKLWMKLQALGCWKKEASLATSWRLSIQQNICEYALLCKYDDLSCAWPSSKFIKIGDAYDDLDMIFAIVYTNSPM